MLFNVPNLITIGRIAVIPGIAAFLYAAQGAPVETDKICSFWAMVLFAIAGISDLVDGYYARKYGQVSTMGKFFDPMADKLIHMAAMVFLIPLGRMNVWVVTILLFREIFINGLRSAAAGEGLIIDAAEWGKRKTAWLNVGFSAIILHYNVFPGTSFELNTRAIGNVCIAIGFLYSVASAVQYTAMFVKKVKK